MNNSRIVTRILKKNYTTVPLLSYTLKSASEKTEARDLNVQSKKKRNSSFSAEMTTDLLLGPVYWRRNTTRASSDNKSLTLGYILLLPKGNRQVGIITIKPSAECKWVGAECLAKDLRSLSFFQFSIGYRVGLFRRNQLNNRANVSIAWFWI